MVDLTNQPDSKSRACRIPRGTSTSQGTSKKTSNNNSKGSLIQCEKIASMGKISAGIVSELYNPIDATNRFINLALHSLEENSQGREFLIESKKGIRKTEFLLKRLNNHLKRIEKEIRSILTVNE